MAHGWEGGVLMAEVEKSEKITINFGLVDLGQIDLLVDDGFTPTAPTSSVRPSGVSWRAARSAAPPVPIVAPIRRPRPALHRHRHRHRGRRCAPAPPSCPCSPRSKARRGTGPSCY